MANEPTSKTILITLTGRTPLLLDAMSEDQLEALRTKKKVQAKTDLTREEQAKLKLYDSPGRADGKIQIPVGNLFAALKGGGRSVSLAGKKKVSTATSSTLPSFLTLSGEWLDVTKPGLAEPAPWVPDMRKGTLKQGAGGVAVAIVRPKFKEWEIKVEAELNLGEANEETLRAVFTQAGKTEGLCSYRPSKGGQFGMFTVTNWEEKAAS